MKRFFTVLLLLTALWTAAQPLSISGNTIVNGKTEVRLNPRTALPEQIFIDGCPVLSAPFQFVLFSGYGVRKFSVSSFEFLNGQHEGIRWRGTVSSYDLDVTLEGSFSRTRSMNLELSIRPKTPVSFSDITLEFGINTTNLPLQQSPKDAHFSEKCIISAGCYFWFGTEKGYGMDIGTNAAGCRLKLYPGGLTKPVIFTSGAADVSPGETLRVSYDFFFSPAFRMEKNTGLKRTFVETDGLPSPSASTDIERIILTNPDYTIYDDAKLPRLLELIDMGIEVYSTPPRTFPMEDLLAGETVSGIVFKDDDMDYSELRETVSLIRSLGKDIRIGLFTSPDSTALINRVSPFVDELFFRNQAGEFYYDALDAETYAGTFRPGETGISVTPPPVALSTWKNLITGLCPWADGKTRPEETKALWSLFGRIGYPFSSFRGPDDEKPLVISSNPDILAATYFSGDRLVVVLYNRGDYTESTTLDFNWQNMAPKAWNADYLFKTIPAEPHQIEEYLSPADKFWVDAGHGLILEMR